MDIFAVAGFAVIAAVLSVLLRQYRPEFSVLIGIGAGVIILLFVLSKAQPAFNELTSLFGRANVSSSYAGILLKALGICFITQLACDACNDAGETAISSKIELAGKFAVLLVALPLFEEIA
ncbi:MAG: SpoIIIAC/SpoIIIAD family protein, partial [Clostridia bacterium]|nr:SpoIIIAC/SpoIIIAD family protein [Clostridia bacterium]